MYKCVECGHLFEDGEQSSWKEAHGESFTGCPLCKGSYEEINPCKICGSYLHDFDEDFCNDCKKDVQSRFKNIISQEFSEEEIELLNILYDGERIC